jgi:hypothetical protein
MNIKFKSVKQLKYPKSKRDRECCVCNKMIRKGNVYQITSFRYDKTFISLYTHLTCPLNF